jgi:hypothetical protein
MHFSSGGSQDFERATEFYLSFHQDSLTVDWVVTI